MRPNYLTACSAALFAVAVLVNYATSGAGRPSPPFFADFADSALDLAYLDIYRLGGCKLASLDGEWYALCGAPGVSGRTGGALWAIAQTSPAGDFAVSPLTGRAMQHAVLAEIRSRDIPVLPPRYDVDLTAVMALFD